MASARPLGICRWLSILLIAVITGGAALGQEGEEPGIRDNSFLIEEAFNQEQGVVQHIFNWVPSWERNRTYSNGFDFVFTQEWPLGSQRHQFSYTLPMLYLYERVDGQPPTEGQGFGDMLLNYRYQLFDGNFCGWWAAPRLSVILPTGQQSEGLGNGKTGYQINLPFTKEFSRCAINFNAGLSVLPDIEVEPIIPPAMGQDRNGYNLGASVIYFSRPYFNLMLETVALWDEELEPDGTEDDTFWYILSPGFRWAIYTEGDTQWVVGAAVPIGLTYDAPDVSAFFYMSFEHRVCPKREN